MAVMTQPMTGLGAALRAWRDRLSPAAAGVPRGPVRRTAGLRREELADRAGLSVDYVVRLEQGRATTPSRQVVAALARALQLSDGERDHLYRLAGLIPPTAREIPEHIPPGVDRVLSRLGEAAVAVFAADWQLIWWNHGWAALLGDPSATPRQLRNFAYDTFPVGGAPARLSHWPVTTLAGAAVDAAVVADLRRATGRFPDNRRLAEVVGTLSAGSPRFAELWASAEVGAHRESRKVIAHPDVGATTVDCDVLTDGDSELKIVIMTAAHGTEDATRMTLALLSGVREALPR